LPAAGGRPPQPWSVSDVNKPTKYEVAIFNKDVRQQVKIGEKHKDFTDDWADMHYIVVTAMNE
jgi:hypothetical protein